VNKVNVKEMKSSLRKGIKEALSTLPPAK